MKKSHDSYPIIAHNFQMCDCEASWRRLAKLWRVVTIGRWAREKPSAVYKRSNKAIFQCRLEDSRVHPVCWRSSSLLILARGTTLDSLVVLCRDGNRMHSLWIALWKSCDCCNLIGSTHIPAEKTKCWLKSPDSFSLPPPRAPPRRKRGWLARLNRP